MAEEPVEMAEALAGLRQLERWVRGMDKIGAALRVVQQEQSLAEAARKEWNTLTGGLAAEIARLEAERAQVQDRLVAEHQQASTETQALIMTVVEARQRALAEQDRLAAETATDRAAMEHEIKTLRKDTQAELNARVSAYGEQERAHRETLEGIRAETVTLSAVRDALTAEIADLRRRVGAL